MLPDVSPLEIKPFVFKPSNNCTSDIFLLVVKLYNLPVFVPFGRIKFWSYGVYVLVIKFGNLKYSKVISGYAIASIISAALLKSILYLEGSIGFSNLFKTLKFSGLIATLSNFIVSVLRKTFRDLKSVVIV